MATAKVGQSEADRGCVLADHALAIRQGLHFAAMDGEGVLLDLVRDRYWGLYSLGAAMWQALEDGSTRGQTIEGLTGEHELSRAEAEEALETQLASWSESGLLVSMSSAAADDDPGGGLQAKVPGSPASRMLSVDGVRRFGTGAGVRLVRARQWAGRRLKHRRPDHLLAEVAGRDRFVATMLPRARTTVAAYRALRKVIAKEDDCLLTTITLARALQMQGVSCDICFGVRKVPFLAHAWVEIDGQSVDPPQALARLTVVARF